MKLVWKNMFFIHCDLCIGTLIDQILYMNIVHIVLPETLADISFRALLNEIAVTDIIQFWIKTLDLGLKIHVLAALKVFLKHLKLFQHVVIVLLVSEVLYRTILLKLIVLVSHLIQFIELEVIYILITLGAFPAMLLC